MKVLAIGDIHGDTIWKQVLNNHIDAVDKVVFIGDYWDTHLGFTFQEQRQNFLDIVEIKKIFSKKITLLLGNHDMHYILSSEEYSGYQHTYASAIEDLIKENIEHFQVCVEYDKVLYSHAGVTENWQDRYLSYTVESINSLLVKKPNAFSFHVFDALRPESKFRNPNPYGDNVWQGPMWVRPQSLKQRPGTLQYSEIYTPKQVVGHTHANTIEIKKSSGTEFAFIDALPSQYLIVDKGDFIVCRV